MTPLGECGENSSGSCGGTAAVRGAWARSEKNTSACRKCVRRLRDRAILLRGRGSDERLKSGWCCWKSGLPLGETSGNCCDKFKT